MIEVARAEEWLTNLPPETVDMLLTSPPYDGIRDYHGFDLVDLGEIGRCALRAVKQGGVAVLVMQDQTKRGHKSLTTFRTACSWVDAGWGLFECLIWNRHGVPGAWWRRRFRVDHEYVLVFVKGSRPYYFDKSHMMVPTVGEGRIQHGYARTTDGGKLRASLKPVAATKCPGTVLTWNPTKCECRDETHQLKRQHPATFPDALASDMIRCFSTPGDLVVDPMAGSGTTLVEAVKAGRRAAGCDVSQEYASIARRRLEMAT